MKQYDYIIMDTKLWAYSAFHAHRPVLDLLSQMFVSLRVNRVALNYARVIWAHDLDKSEYRTRMWKDYKRHRDIVAKRSSITEQKRRELFVSSYKDTPKVLNYLGVSAITKGMEADDIVSIVRHLRPKAKILMLSLDLDWLLNVDEDTHLLFHKTNTLYTSPEQVEDKLGIHPTLYPHLASIGSQAKDNILNIAKFGKARFLKELVVDGKLVHDYDAKVDQILKDKKYGCAVNPKAKYTDWRSNYQLNMQLMQPIPINLVDIDELTTFDRRLDNDLPTITYEEFLIKCIDEFNHYPDMTEDDFNICRSND